VVPVLVQFVGPVERLNITAIVTAPHVDGFLESQNMLKTSLFSVVVLLTGAGPARPPSPFEIGSTPPVRSQIDKLVFTRLKQLNIEPANLCSDAVFLRRVYLDVIGTLPSPQQARQFLADPNQNKRSVLIDRLLEREEFADYWAMKWGDLLRIKAEFPINLWPNAAQAYHRWVRCAIKANMPYDKFARELLTSSGSNFRVPQVNFYRAVQSKDPQTIAKAVALTFMGTRAEKWEKSRLDGMAVFFSKLAYKSTGEWKEEIVRFDPEMSPDPNLGPQPLTGVFPDGSKVLIRPDKDPRQVFADWLIDPKNPWFTRNIANRLWSWLLGRGIIHEPDDIRPDNPPSNPELLSYLELKLVEAKYDLKELYRLILNSSTYQLSSVPKSDTPQARANFAYYPIRRLEAEVLIDALNMITGTTEKYSSAIPEPYTFIPEDRRSIALADGSITSPFLEMFGRPPRDTGLEAERSNRPTPAQRLHLINSSHIQRKIERGPKLRYLMQSRRTPRQIASTLYLTILSRFPTRDEIKTVEEYISTGKAGKGRTAAVVDLIWALINSPEFLYRH